MTQEQVTSPRKGRQRKYQDRICEWCGTSFYPAMLSGNPCRFCSVPCANAYKGRNGVIRTCQVCGDDFRVMPSKAAARYCSRPCAGVAVRTRALDREHNGRPAFLDNSGYIRIYMPDHPRAFHNGYFLEHRHVVEQQLDRMLETHEHVHHINGEPADNRPENLQVMSRGEHMAITVAENTKRLREWKEYRRLYGPLKGGDAEYDD